MSGVMLTARDEDSGRILDLTALSDAGADIRIVPWRDGYLVEAWRQPIGKVDVRMVRTSGGY